MRLMASRYFTIISTALLCFAYATPASSVSSQCSQCDCLVKNTWFINIGAGGASISLPSDTTIDNGSGATPPSNVDTYTIGNASATMTQLAVGYRWYRKADFIPYTSFALQYRHYMNANIDGTVDQYTLPGFINYNYQIRYGADMFILNAKVDLIERSKIMPYLTGGLGVALTHINDYTESATAGVTPRTSPDFNGNTIKHLVATAGAGLDYILTDNIWLTLGYEHVFQSDLMTRSGNGSWSPTKLNLGNPSMDTVFVSMSANIDAFRS